MVGCGVIGLSTAIRLLEADLSVRILAASLPPETTSSVAAAIWYPYNAYPKDRVLSWGGRTFEVFEELSGAPESGVMMREGLEIWPHPAPDPWWAEAVRYPVRRLAPEELPPGYTDGHSFVVPIVEMPIYLGYLLRRFREAGGEVEVRSLRSLDEIDGAGALTVNCSGLGARKLVHDSSMVPIRGQIVRVSNPGLERFVMDEENSEGVAYIIPRSRDCILGGTADEGEWDTTPDPSTAEAILRRCARLEPRLKGARVLEHRVGLRPGRPRIRLELEEAPDGTLRLHNYGHGGAGVTLSWGCAEDALRLALEALEEG